MLCFLFPLFPPDAHCAQDTLTLTPSTGSIALGPHGYITTQDESSLDFATLLSRYKQNLRGQHSEGSVIYLGAPDSTVWIVFAVNNTSGQQEWFIDFGQITDGRSGQISALTLVNDADQKAYSTKTGQSISLNGVSVPVIKASFVNSAMKVHLDSHHETLLALKIDWEKGLPLALTPRLVAEDAYLGELSQGNGIDIFKGLFFISLLMFFTALLFMTRSPKYLAFIGYYLLIYAFLYYSDAHLIAPFSGSGFLLVMFFCAAQVSSLAVTRFFSNITHEDRPLENMVLIVVWIMCVVSVFIFSFVTRNSIAGYVIFSLVCALVILTDIILGVFIRRKDFLVAGLFGAGWLFGLGGQLALMLSLGGMLAPAGALGAAYCYALFPQGLCFVLCCLQEFKQLRKKRRKALIREKREGQNMARLQKSKESADQARLLRVIERERELMNELREREAKRTEEMRKAKDIADKANQAKSAFLAVVSHEIRTPMTGILGMVQLLRDTNMTPRQNDYVDTIRKSGDTMMALLNDILDFEKIERGGMELENVAFDLRQLANDIVILMSGHASQKNVELGLEVDDDVPRFVSGDPTRLRQVLLNLVNNGLKFTEKGHVTIQISSRALPNDPSMYGVRFAVIDSGIGISKQAQEKLFTPFAQAESSTTRKYGGTGLGLAISNRLIEAMGSKIMVESEEGMGTTFYFTVNMRVQAGDDISGEDSTGVKAAHRAAPMRILVTEDNEMNRKVLEGLLIKNGHEVFMSANGMEALQQIAKYKPDVVLMDIEMDGMDGLETTQRIRAHIDKTIANIPIIALTGNVLLDDIERFFAAGMNGFIGKPIDPEKLDQVLYNVSEGKLDNPLPKVRGEDTQKAAQEDDPLLGMKLDLSLDEREHYIDDRSVGTDTPDGDSPLPGVQTGSLAFEEDQSDMPISNKPAQEQAPIHRMIDQGTLPPASPVHSPVNKITPSAPPSDIQKKAFSVRKKKQEDLTEIQKYLLNAGEGTESHAPSSMPSSPSPQVPEEQESEAERHAAPPSALLPSPVETENDQSAAPIAQHLQPHAEPLALPAEPEDYLDISMLDTLVSSLGSEQLSGLMDGFMDKEVELIGNIQACIETRDISALGARAHELKGMAGNFGMKKVSEISGLAEKAAKTGNSDEALAQAQKLNAAHEATMTAFEQWKSKKS